MREILLANHLSSRLRVRPGIAKSPSFSGSFRKNRGCRDRSATRFGFFFNLTISDQFDILSREANGEPVVLMGSSMGGYLAALYASRHPEVEKLVLLAPAFGFQDRWAAMLGEEKFQAWEETGELEVFHYADNAPRKVGWQLAVDAKNWEPVPHFTQPALVFHGRNDLTVPISTSEAYAASHPNVTLEKFDAGHELTEVIDEMWERTARFLKI